MHGDLCDGDVHYPRQHCTFDRFFADFPIEPDASVNEPWGSGAIEGFEELMSMCAGSTFERGLYRLHSREFSESATVAIAEAFPELVGGIAPFGFDWLGRQFVVDLRPGRTREVLLVEPGTRRDLADPGGLRRLP